MFVKSSPAYFLHSLSATFMWLKIIQIFSLLTNIKKCSFCNICNFSVNYLLISFLQAEEPECNRREK